MNHSTIKIIILLLFISIGKSVISAGPLDPMPSVNRYESINEWTTDIQCHGGVGTIAIQIIGGTGFTYQWKNSSGNVVATTKDLTNATAGAYTVTLFKNGNNSTWNFTLTEPSQLNVSLETDILIGGYNISTHGGSDGWIHCNVYGGVPSYYYDWSNNASNVDEINGLTVGTYSVTVTDENGCSVDTSITLTSPPAPLHVDTAITRHHGFAISCNGGNDGVIDLTVTGGVTPYHYNWGNGVYTQDRTGLTAGNYTVIVDDDISGDADTIHFTLNQPSSLTLNLNSYVFSNGFNTSAYNSSDGSITSSISGGVSPYAYLWNNNATTANISGLAKGRDTVTVTDNNGCKIKNSIEITSTFEGWKIGGNLGIDTSKQFVGTKDSIDVILKTNNVKRMTIKADGTVEMNAPLKILRTANCSPSDARVVYAHDDGTIDFVSCDLINGPPCQNSLVNPWYNIINNQTCQQFNTSDIFLGSDYRNVGIGTPTPSVKLDVVGSIRSSNLSTTGFNLVYTGTNGNGSLTSLPPPTINPSSYVLYGNGTWNTLPSGPWTYNGTDIFNNPLSANIGIGTSSPSSQTKLQIDHNTASGIIINRINAGTKHSEIRFSNNGTEKWAIGNDLSQNGSNNFFIWNEVKPAGNGVALFIDGNNNNVGIDKNVANAKLDVNGNIQAGSTSAVTISSIASSTAHASLWSKNNSGSYGFGVDVAGLGHIYSNTTANPIMTFSDQGFVGIGPSFSLSNIQSPRSTDYVLYVEGSIAAREIKVTIANFPDFVFNEDYNLLSIHDLQKFIDKNHHLPNFPSAKEVESEDGVEISKLQVKLVKTIEEQTLYILSLQKQIDELKEKLK